MSWYLHDGIRCLGKAFSLSGLMNASRDVLIDLMYEDENGETIVEVP
jgi:hypothetical protein